MYARQQVCFWIFKKRRNKVAVVYTSLFYVFFFTGLFWNVKTNTETKLLSCIHVFYVYVSFIYVSFMHVSFMHVSVTGLFPNTQTNTEAKLLSYMYVLYTHLSFVGSFPNIPDTWRNKAVASQTCFIYVCLFYLCLFYIYHFDVCLLSRGVSKYSRQTQK